jgi:hypothetical protein
MTTFKVFKETALPATLVPHAVYFIAPAAHSDLLEIYVTNADVSTPHRHVLNRTEVQAMIDASIAAANELSIVADIGARDELTPDRAQYVYVVDATDDATVGSGGATYLWNPATSAWIKTSEAESLDVSVTWASITGKPTSTPAQIDAAVAASHSHSNKAQLDLIGQDAEGNMTFDGALPATAWASTGW